MFYRRRTNEHKLRGLKQLPLLVSRHVGQEARKSLTEFPAVCHAMWSGRRLGRVSFCPHRGGLWLQDAAP